VTHGEFEKFSSAGMEEGNYSELQGNFSIGRYNTYTSFEPLL